MAKTEPTKKVESKPEATPTVFSIPAGDPYINGVIRCYVNASKGKPKADVNKRPFDIALNDPAAEAAIENYILRARGGGDNKRAEIAAAALKKIKG